MNTVVLAVGETMALVSPDPAAPLESAQSFRMDIGGAESNVASHLVREGVPSAWAGAVGDDPLGSRVLATLERRGVDTSLAVVDRVAPTGLYLKDPALVTRVYYYRSGSAASRLDAGYADALPLREVPWVHLSGITLAVSSSCERLVDRILDERAARRMPVSFDVNFRAALWRERPDAALRLLAAARRADIVFVGRDEADLLWDEARPDAIAALLEPHGTLVVKDAGAAAHAYRAGEHVSVAPEPAHVVEPVGAGDAFAAGYLAAVIRQPDDLEAALRAGHRAAARVLSTTLDY